MKRVSRNIDPGCARDLLERVPRACLCFACDHGPQAQPIVLVWHDGRYLAGIPLDADRQPGPGQEVVLLIDKGVHYMLDDRPAPRKRRSEHTSGMVGLGGWALAGARPLRARC